MGPPTLSLRDVACCTGAVVRVVQARYRLPWHDAEDLIAETVLELLERHERQPGLRVRLPWQAIQHAVMEARRRRAAEWARSGSAGAVEVPALAVAPNQLDRERLIARLDAETARERESEARRRFETESVAARRERYRWTCRALGTIPAGPGETHGTQSSGGLVCETTAST